MFLQAQGGSWTSMLPLIAMIFVFFFFFIRPQQKKQKDQKRYEDQLKKGDNVVTSSGILGVVNKVEDDIITLQLENKTFIRVMKSAISKEYTDLVFHKKEEESAKQKA